MTDTENAVEPTEAQTPVESDSERDINQETAKFSQADLDKIVAERLAREKRKWEKKFDGIDPDHYKELAEKQEAERQERLKAKGEFEKLLKEQAEKSSQTIAQLKNQIHSVKVDGALLNAASKHKAINPDQVVQLVKSQVRLNEAGEAEVIDPKTGQTRYTDSGDPASIDGLVKEFLQINSHFVAATPAGSGTTSRVGDSGAGENLDVSKLDMSNPKHRQIYAQYRKDKGIAR